MTGQNPLLAIIKVNTCSHQHPEGFLILSLNGGNSLIVALNPLEAAGVSPRPYRFDGIHDQKLTVRGRSVRSHMETCKIILHVTILFIPGGLIKNTCRVISLILALHRVPGKMRAEEVDSHQRLPVSYGFIIFKLHLPARAAEKLCEHLFLIHLMRYGTQLFGNPPAAGSLAQKVDSGDIHIFITGHQRTQHTGLVRKRILVKKMTGEKPAVLLTAVLDLLQEIFQEEILYQLQIIQRYAGKGFALFPQENFRKVLLQIIAVTLLEGAEKLIRVGMDF